MGRAPCCDKLKVKRGPWSPEEDATLRSHIQNHGTGGNWIALPHKIGLKRCGKSCRLRWLNYLRPNLRHGGYTEDEDNLICSLYLAIGSRWSIIAAQLPGRTDNDIKNYWNTRLKKKLLGKQRSRDARISNKLAHEDDGTTTCLYPPPLLPNPNMEPNFSYLELEEASPFADLINGEGMYGSMPQLFNSQIWGDATYPSNYQQMLTVFDEARLLGYSL